MSNAELVSDLMVEVGPILELRGIVEINGEAQWVLDVDGELAVVAEYFEADDRLFFTADAGVPDPSARLVCYELLLAYNAMWRQTGGVRMAVNGEDGAVLQIADIAVDGLDAAKLATVLRNFIGKLGEWIDIIEMDPEQSAANAAGAPAAPNGAGAVRV